MKTKEAFYTVQGWMHRQGLRPLELLLFARIYTMSIQELWYRPSTDQTAAFYGVSKPTILSAFDRLIALDLVEKKDVTDRTGMHRELRAKESVVMEHFIADGGKETLLPSVKKFYQPDGEGGKEILPGAVKNFNGGGKETLPAHLIYRENINDNISENINCTVVQSAPADAVASEPSSESAPSDESQSVENSMKGSDAPAGNLFAEIDPAFAKNQQPGAAGKERKNSAQKKEKAESSPEFEKFQEWIANHAPDVAKMQQPFTLKQFEELSQKYDANDVAEVLEAMGNKVGLTKTYKSAYLTCCNWLRARDKKRGSAPAPRPEYNQPAAPAPESIQDRRRQRSAEADKIINEKFYN